jgi:hypothetical protein
VQSMTFARRCPNPSTRAEVSAAVAADQFCLCEDLALHGTLDISL